MSLLAEERKKEITQLLEHQGRVKVNELADRLNVSTETIRRYLDDLEGEQKLKKVYGGAIPVEQEKELPHYERTSLHSEAKKLIGKLAADEVNDHDRIVIDEGSTPLHMIPFLSTKKNLTIMTCSIPALNQLVDYQKRQQLDARILFIGGEVSVEHLRVSGSIAEKMMEDFYVNKAFIAADGVHIDHGVTSYDPNKALFTKKLMEQSEQNYIMADSSKVGLRTYVKMATLDDIHTIVSNEAPPSNWTASLESTATNWLYPKNA
ncbi:cytochrome C [Pontibacillus halophilus JSM 076056 = DSM 19796]|uniref:Cytochrome C n=1 Tax=Pontibacillus halophilus JSM 076056 = DSM 19796 TaxID=1385510 RepID=A0A0A5GSB2_9BACI|nr:DeoR/GlpR family DNA-binding transcription regulator [Pontibacillus halophilus]KGX94015.1 cytochrome C [Pontibacillus halophilus JSM 076056 = DSM 19796]